MSDKNEAMVIDVKLAQLPILNFDYEKIRTELEKELKQYDVVVTGDTVKGAKELATKLNKVAGVIDDKRKSMVAEASEPIKTFDAKMKELVQLCKDGRQKILDQVQGFEDKTLDLCRALLKEELAALAEKFKLLPEYNDISIEGLALISHVTDSGKLAKAARDKLEGLVLARVEVQVTTEKRLHELETRSYREGLAAPLTKAHVRAFLFAEDEEYERQLSELFKIELQRQQDTEARLRTKVERETKTTAAPRQVERSAGKVNWLIQCEFELKLDEDITQEQIRAQFMRKMADAGFTTLSSVKVERL